MTLSDFSNRTAVVTGAGRGLGRAAARALAERGAAVVLVARTAAEIESAAQEILQRGGRALACAADVSDASAVERMVAAARDTFGPPDILVNNAAVIAPIGQTWTSDPHEWQTLFAVNVIGAYLCARATIPGMLRRGWGRIINVSSGAAEMDIEGMGAYCASKAALERFSTTLQVELRDSSIAVIVFRPGIVDTPMQETIRAAPRAHFPRVGEWQAFHRTGRLRPPETVASRIVDLAGDEGARHAGRIVSV